MYELGKILKSKHRKNLYVMVCGLIGNGLYLDQTTHQFRAIIIHSDNEDYDCKIGQIYNNWNKGEHLWEETNIQKIAIDILEKRVFGTE